MVLVLCIGDLNIPYSSAEVPGKLKALLQPGKIHQILCTGNLCDQHTVDFLKSVTSNVIITQGDSDDLTTWPDTAVLELGEFRVGVCHGHQIIPPNDKAAIGIMQKRMNVDILVKGGEREFGAYRHEGCIVINPGSATGTCRQGNGDVGKPSFALMDIKGNKASVYVYQLDDSGEVKVEKIEFSK